MALGAVALAVAFPAGPALLLNLYWWAITAVLLTGLASALGGARPAVLTAEALLSLVLAHAMLRPAGGRTVHWSYGNGIAWQFSFERPDQRILKVVPRPKDWDIAGRAFYVRIDLARPYAGAAGLAVSLNHQPLGVLTAH